VPDGALLAALTAGLLLVVWAATTGPVAVLSDSGRRIHFSPPTRRPSPSPFPGLESGRDVARNLHSSADLRWIGTLLAWALLIAVATAVVLLLRLAWRHRWRPPEREPEVEFEVVPRDRLARVIRDDGARQLDAMAGGDPRNGIVRCWLRLEENIAAAGLPRQPAETSSEFTVRVLKTLDVDPRAIGELARLYREARFSDHELQESQRTAARSALQRLHSDLRELELTGTGR
jgi:hypothetical protein